MSGPWRVAGVSADGSVADIKDETHCVANGVRADKAELICQEHNAAQQPDPVREALVAALRDVTNELQAWHDERPDSPGLRDLCVTCGYLDEARSVIAAAEEPREEGTG